MRAFKALALQCAAHLFVGGGTHGLVQLALPALQLHAQDGLGTRRKLGGHILFAASQYEGAHALRQQLGAQGFAVFLDGLAPAGVEAAHIAQKAGHQKVELRPQLAQVVLQRRARQAQQVRCLQLAQGAGAAAAGVFHHLRFVQDQQVKGLRGQRIHIAPQQRVGGQHQVVVCNVWVAFGTVGTMQRQHAQAGRHARSLGLPVEEQRGGQHHQRGAGEPARFLLGQHVGQGLCGFAQAHVVGQDAAQALLAQVLQPGQALQLVGAQLHLQPLRRCHRLGRADAAQALGQVGQARIALQLPVVAPAIHGAHTVGLHQPGAQGLDAAGLPRAQVQRIAILALVTGRVGQQVHHGAHDGLERPGGRVDAFAAGCAQRNDGDIVDGGHLLRVQPAGIAAQQVGQQRRQVQGFAVDLDTQRQQPGAFALGQHELLHGARARG